MNDILDKQDSHSSGMTDQPVWQILQKAKDNVYDALCDSFNTSSAMRTISEMISEYNSADKKVLTIEQSLDTARWVTSMVNTFGLNGATKADDNSIGWSGIGIPEHAKPCLASISSMRDHLRQQARSSSGLDRDRLRNMISSGGTEISADNMKEAVPYHAVLSNFQADVSALTESDRLSKDILQLCDRIRDVDLWNLGIYLEDRPDDQPALIRPVTRELRAAKAEQEAREEQKKRAKEDREKEAAAKADKGKLSHFDMFRTAEYSAWDEEGLPLKDAAGEEITKSKGKKLRKDWERQKKMHEAWRKATSS